MSIVPVGKNRHQVNQGGFKHESMLSSDAFNALFHKIALAPGSVVDKVDQDIEVPDDLQSAMNQGGLDPEVGMPEGADMGGKKTPTPKPTSPMNQNMGMPQTQVGGADFEQSLEAQYGPRVARIVAGFLNELREAEMMSATFTPDPMGTKFTIGGGGLELKVPAMRSGGGRAVEKA